MDEDTTLEDLKKQIRKFRDDRNWDQHHSAKNLATSIVLEVSELLEHFQWDDFTKSEQAEVEQELADVIIYCLFFADKTKIDISKAVSAKLKAINKKYPAELFNNKESAADTHKQIKMAYRDQKNNRV